MSINLARLALMSWRKAKNVIAPAMRAARQMTAIKVVRILIMLCPVADHNGKCIFAEKASSMIWINVDETNA
jgi:hypothetical protein